MHDLVNLKGYRSILCLNGDLPELSFFNTINLPIIAADGAANSLLGMGISPQLIIGDLDSVNPSILEKHAFLHLPNQNSNDYQKAMHHLKDKGLLPAIVVGINGGYLDHVLNNINIFMDSDCVLYAPPVKGLVIKENSRFSVLLPEQTKVSLIGIPNAVVSSVGLKWELKQSTLSFPGKTSCFNRTSSTQIELAVHEGAVLVLIYEQNVADAGSTS